MSKHTLEQIGNYTLGGRAEGVRSGLGVALASIASKSRLAFLIAMGAATFALAGCPEDTTLPDDDDSSVLPDDDDTSDDDDSTQVDDDDSAQSLQCEVDLDGDGFGNGEPYFPPDGDCSDENEVLAGGKTDCNDSIDTGHLAYPGRKEDCFDGLGDGKPGTPNEDIDNDCDYILDVEDPDCEGKGDDDDSAGDDDDGDDDSAGDDDGDDDSAGDDDGDDDDSASDDDDGEPEYEDGPLDPVTAASLDGGGSPSLTYAAGELGLSGSSTQVVAQVSLTEDTVGAGVEVDPLAYHAATESLSTAATGPVASYEQPVPLVAASASNPNEIAGLPAVATITGGSGTVAIADPQSTGSVEVCEASGANVPATNAADATWVMYDAIEFALNGSDPSTNPQSFGNSFDNCVTTDASSAPIQVGDGTYTFVASEQ